MLNITVFHGGGAPETTSIKGFKAKCLTAAQKNDNIPNMLGIKKRQNHSYAFTLAEVLITLGIIGIVSALVMPGIIANVNKKAWSEAQYVVRRKMQEATNQMKTHERLHGYNSTEDFVKEFRKYMKFVQVCDNTKLKDCYSPKVLVTSEKEVEVNELKTSYTLGHEDYNTNTVGLVIADGTTIIMSYNPNCPFIEPSNNTIDTLSCISMIYDINGKKKPNKIGEDIAAVNAVITTCDLKINDVCVAASDLSYRPINTCAEGSGDPYFTLNYLFQNVLYPPANSCEENYWYGAKKGCEALGMRLPTLYELRLIWSAVNKDLSKYNFLSSWYWTSTEDSNPVYAWHKQFSKAAQGQEGNMTKDSPTGSVRCVR